MKTELKLIARRCGDSETTDALDRLIARMPDNKPKTLSPERIDAIAELVVKGMPNGILGFCGAWGWQTFARALLNDCAGYSPEHAVRQPLVLRGVAHVAGDGFKDDTRIGDAAIVWNRQRPEPYAPGQFPRVGNPIYSASADQFRFRPLSEDEAVAEIDREIEELRAKWHDARDTGRVKLASDVPPFLFQDLLRRVVAILASDHVRRKRRDPPFWSRVSDATALGSTCAAGLARWAGFDPDTGKELPKGEN